MARYERRYRMLCRSSDLVYFQIVVQETDLYVGVRRERLNETIPSEVEKLVRSTRETLETYIGDDPEFVKSLKPYPVNNRMPPLAQMMAAAATAAGVGPMAAVAGAFADLTGRYLAKYSRDVIVENGGDIFLKATKPFKIGIYAGTSPFSEHVAIEVPSFLTPLGICTSSGTVGHSLSFGCADAVVIMARTATLADAVATSAANLVQSVSDLQSAVDFARNVPGVLGAVAIKDDRLAACGQVKLVPLQPD